MQLESLIDQIFVAVSGLRRTTFAMCIYSLYFYYTITRKSFRMITDPFTVIGLEIFGNVFNTLVKAMSVCEPQTLVQKSADTYRT